VEYWCLYLSAFEYWRCIRWIVRTMRSEKPRQAPFEFEKACYERWNGRSNEGPLDTMSEQVGRRKTVRLRLALQVKLAKKKAVCLRLAFFPRPPSVPCPCLVLARAPACAGRARSWWLFTVPPSVPRPARTCAPVALARCACLWRAWATMLRVPLSMSI